MIDKDKWKGKNNYRIMLYASQIPPAIRTNGTIVSKIPIAIFLARSTTSSKVITVNSDIEYKFQNTPWTVRQMCKLTTTENLPEWRYCQMGYSRTRSKKDITCYNNPGEMHCT